MPLSTIPKTTSPLCNSATNLSNTYQSKDLIFKAKALILVTDPSKFSTKPTIINIQQWKYSSGIFKK